MSEPASDPLLGQVLGGRYRIERMLGRGGAGAVYEASQLDLDRKVAIKTLRPELSDDATLLERFRREARAAASLGHPHIAAVLDWGDPRGSEPAFIVFEILRGDSLLELLRRETRLSPERAVRLMAQLLSALETAHRAGIVHRDLKPGNVMVTPIPGFGESLKLLDFGIAQIKEGEAFQKLTRTGVVMGTPRYMAPEQLRGSGVELRTDVWAAGVVLYRMLTGSMPFDGAPNDVVMAVLTQPPPPMSPELGVPAALEAVVSRALAKSPADRWPSAAAMYDAIESAMRAPPPQRLASTLEVPILHARVSVDETRQSRTSQNITVLADTAAAAPAALPPRRNLLVPTLVTVLALGGCGVFGTATVLLAWFGDFHTLLVSPLTAPSLPSVTPSHGGSAPSTGSLQDDDLPRRAPADTYLAIAEERVLADDPGAVLDSAYFSGVGSDGLIDLDAAGTATFFFRLDSGECRSITLPSVVAGAPAPCRGYRVLTLPPLEDAIRQARALCPVFADQEEPFTVSFSGYANAVSATMMATSNPASSFTAQLMPDGTLGPMPYTGILCR